MKFRGWLSTENHLEEMIAIRDRTPFLKRLFQRYNMPSSFPYAQQGISQLLSPCTSVVSLEVENGIFSIKSLENQKEGMPLAKPVNFDTSIHKEISLKSVKSISTLSWSSPIVGWSKRNWLKVVSEGHEPFLISVNEIPKQLNSRKTEELLKLIKNS